MKEKFYKAEGTLFVLSIFASQFASFEYPLELLTWESLFRIVVLFIFGNFCVYMVNSMTNEDNND